MGLQKNEGSNEKSVCSQHIVINEEKSFCSYFSRGMENQYSGLERFLYDSMGQVFDTVLLMGTPTRRHRYSGGSSNCCAGFGTKSTTIAKN